MDLKERRHIIFDIDGTLADCEHRVKYVKGHRKDWQKFTEESVKDPPHHDIVWLLKTLFHAGHTILIVTARPEDEREMTIEWLHNVAGLEGYYERMYMRYSDDYRDDATIKKDLLQEIYDDGYVPIMVFDDREHVVDMWRANGIRCLQVAPGAHP